MGTFFRTVDQSSVDVEDLFHMLNQKPVVTEIENAKDYEYKDGGIEFHNLGFKHHIPVNDESKKINFEEKLLF